MAFAPTQVINNTKPFTSMEGLWQGYSFTQEDFQRFSGDGRSTYFHFDGNLSEHCQKFVDNVITPAQKMREKITLACSECKQRNYDSMKNKKNDPDRVEMKKYCKFCKKHTDHKETK